jgi:hypothetical protein
MYWRREYFFGILSTMRRMIAIAHVNYFDWLLPPPLLLLKKVPREVHWYRNKQHCRTDTSNLTPWGWLDSYYSLPLYGYRYRKVILVIIPLTLTLDRSIYPWGWLDISLPGREGSKEPTAQQLEQRYTYRWVRWIRISHLHESWDMSPYTSMSLGKSFTCRLSPWGRFTSAGVPSGIKITKSREVMAHSAEDKAFFLWWWSYLLAYKGEWLPQDPPGFIVILSFACPRRHRMRFRYWLPSLSCWSYCLPKGASHEVKMIAAIAGLLSPVTFQLST